MTNAFQKLLDAIGILPVGMAFIVVVLWGIYLACAGIGRLFVHADRTREKAAAQAMSPVVPTEAEAPGTNEDDIPLVIAAAIDRVLEGQSYRIISIKPLNNSNWVELGRVNQFRMRHSL